MAVAPPPPQHDPRGDDDPRDSGRGHVTRRDGNDDSGGSSGAVAFAWLSSTALFVAATFQAASQRPSVLVSGYEPSPHLPPSLPYVSSASPFPPPHARHLRRNENK